MPCHKFMKVRSQFIRRQQNIQKRVQHCQQEEKHEKEEVIFQQVRIYFLIFNAMKQYNFQIQALKRQMATQTITNDALSRLQFINGI